MEKNVKGRLNRKEVNIFSSPYFIASKLEAFKSRGANDWRKSSDFEDIVFILDSRRLVWKEMQNTDAVLMDYLKTEFKTLLDSGLMEEWVSCHLEKLTSSERTQRILLEMKQFVG